MVNFYVIYWDEDMGNFLSHFGKTKNLDLNILLIYLNSQDNPVGQSPCTSLRGQGFDSWTLLPWSCICDPCTCWAQCRLEADVRVSYVTEPV